MIHGGGSGIGTFAIQWARAIGAHVAVTAGSAEKLERCAELGAEVLINYREQDFVEALPQPVDVILDVVGAKYLDANVRALADGGRLVVIGLQGGVKAELNLGTLLSKRGSVIATSLRSRSPSRRPRSARRWCATCGRSTPPGGSGRSSTGCCRWPTPPRHTGCWPIRAISARSCSRCRQFHVWFALMIMDSATAPRTTTTLAA